MTILLVPRHTAIINKFTDFVSPRTFSARLDELESNMVVKKKVFPQVPPKVECTLTKRGKDLHFILDQMSKWGSGHN